MPPPTVIIPALIPFATPYRVHKRSTKEAWAFQYRNHTFAIHKPMVRFDDLGLPCGWQISKDGVPLTQIKKQTKEEAVAAFITRANLVDDHYFTAGLAKTIRNNIRM